MAQPKRSKRQPTLSRQGSMSSGGGDASDTLSTLDFVLVEPDKFILLTGNAIQKVLSVNELVALVLAQTDETTCAAAACVCKTWHEIASNELWRVLASPFPLIGLLAPLHFTRGQSGQATFNRTPDTSDWRRFLDAAQRVRSLEYTEANKQGRTIDSSIFNAVALGRPIVNFLPSLRRLVIEVSPHRQALEPLLFYSPNVTTFKLERIDPAKSVHDIYPIQQLTRMPGLRDITLGGCLYIPFLVARVTGVLQTLRCLESVTLDTPNAAPKYVQILMASLSSLPNLKKLSITSNKASWHLPGLELIEVETPKSWEFPKLESLMLLRQHASALSSALSQYAFYRLSRLEISVWSDDTIKAEEMEVLFTAIASVGTLDTLSIDANQSAPLLSHSLPMQAMISALSALRLKNLKITDVKPLDLSLSDVDQLAQVLGPSIEVLQLNPYPGRGYTHIPLNLGALNPFAQHCPRLRHLAIFLNATPPPPDTIPELIAFPPALMQISFGHSPMTDRGHVADYLLDMRCPDIIVTSETMVDTRYLADWIVVGEVLDSHYRRETRRKGESSGVANAALERSRAKNRLSRQSCRAHPNGIFVPVLWVPGTGQLPPLPVPHPFADDDSGDEQDYGGVDLGQSDSEDDDNDDDDGNALGNPYW